VIFSNQIREEVRVRNLSFTDIAKLVGDRWQKLTSEEKEPFESQANAAKEKFNVEFALYKKTDSYKQHTHYIAEFKANHSGTTADGKRPRLDPNSNSGIGSSRSNEMTVEARPRVSMAHARDISIGSINCTSYHASVSSPKGGTTVLSPTMMRSRMSTHLSQISARRTANSPPLRPEPYERRIPPVLLLHGSATLDAHQMRSDLPELHSRTGQLSLAPLSDGMISPTADGASCDRFSTAFPPPPLQHQSSVSSVAHSDSSGTSIAPPVTPADEPWRCQSLEAKAKTADWPRMYNPLFGNSHGAPFGPLPPLQPADRVPDVTRDPSQRTLPFPGSSSPHDLQASFRVHLRNATPLAPSESSAESPGENRDETRSPLDSSESDAVTALAVLAYTGR
jgi:HMG (high mobility group) box